MPILFELAVVIALAYFLGRVVPPWLQERRRLRADREAHQRRLSLIEKTDDVIGAVLTDRELARDMHEKLGRLLEQAEKQAQNPAEQPGGDQKKLPP